MSRVRKEGCLAFLGISGNHGNLLVAGLVNQPPLMSVLQPSSSPCSTKIQSPDREFRLAVIYLPPIITGL